MCCAIKKNHRIHLLLYVGIKREVCWNWMWKLYMCWGGKKKLSRLANEVLPLPPVIPKALTSRRTERNEMLGKKCYMDEWMAWKELITFVTELRLQFFLSGGAQLNGRLNAAHISSFLNKKQSYGVLKFMLYKELRTWKKKLAKKSSELNWKWIPTNRNYYDNQKNRIVFIISSFAHKMSPAHRAYRIFERRKR